MARAGVLAPRAATILEGCDLRCAPHKRDAAACARRLFSAPIYHHLRIVLTTYPRERTIRHMRETLENREMSETTTTTSTGHTITVDRDAMLLRIGGDLDDADLIPDSEIDALCAQAGVVCTYDPADTDAYHLITAEDIA